MNAVGTEWVTPGLPRISECSGYGMGHTWVTEDVFFAKKKITIIWQHIDLDCNAITRRILSSIICIILTCISGSLVFDIFKYCRLFHIIPWMLDWLQSLNNFSLMCHIINL